MRSLFLVRGNDVEGENQDLFVVAENPQMAIQIWNNWCVNESWQRTWHDQMRASDVIEPQNVRKILNDVTGTRFDNGLNHGVDWATLPLVA